MSGRIEARIEYNRERIEGDRKKSTANHSWLKRTDDLGQIKQEMTIDSLDLMNPIAMQSREVAEKEANSMLAERIKPELAGRGLDVKVDLNLENLSVFRGGNVYVVCKNLSIAKKYLGNGNIEQVSFTSVNKVLGGKCQIDINPSQFLTYQKEGEVCVTTNEKYAEENNGWVPAKDVLDLSRCFGKLSSDSGTDKKGSKKTIIDLSGPLWDKYKESIKRDGVDVAFGQFLSDVGGGDMEKLLDEFNELDKAFRDELCADMDNRSNTYSKENGNFKGYLIEFGNKLKSDKIYEKEMDDIVKGAKESIEEMKKVLLEKAFELFKEGAEEETINSICTERKALLSKASKEAKEEIDRRDYHYRDYEVIRNEFLIYHFKLKKGDQRYSEEKREEYIASMKKKLEKSIELCKWEMQLDERNIEGDFKLLLENDRNDATVTGKQNDKFEEFIESEEGKLTKRLLREIDYLSNKNFWEEKPLDEGGYQKCKEKFNEDQRIFFGKYFNEGGEKKILEEDYKKGIIKDLNDKLIAAREKLYKKHFESFLNKSGEKGNIIKLGEGLEDLLEDQNLVGEPELLRRLQFDVYRRDQKKYFPASCELVRAAVKEGALDIDGHIEELKDILEDRVKLVREEINKVKNPDRTMREIAKEYRNILEDNGLSGKLEANLDEDAEGEINRFLEDIRDIDENIPYKLRDGAFRKEYSEKIKSFIDSVNKFKESEGSEDLDEETCANDVYQKVVGIREFLHEKMFGEFVKDYQGQDYFAFKNMYSRIIQKDALGGEQDGIWGDESENMEEKCFSKEYKLLKVKDRDKIEDCFSDMAKSAKESLEVAVKKGEEKVGEAEVLPPTEGDEKKRIEKLKQILSDYQKLVRSIEQRRQREQDSVIKSYGDHLEANDHEELIGSLKSSDQLTMRNNLEEVKILHNGISKALPKDHNFKSDYANRIKIYMKNVNAFKDAKAKNKQVLAEENAEKAKESIGEIEHFVSDSILQVL